MRLKEIKEIKGIVEVITGLHIGAGKDSLEIGGLDQPIIKHPITKAPYIPGSSLKGKMRSLLELAVFSPNNLDTQKFVGQGKPCGCGKKGCPCCAIFGTASNKRDQDLGPTRLIVRDAYLTEDFNDSFRKGNLPMEVKYENTIDRIKGIADNPRPLERVPSGVEFNLNLGFKVFEDDPDNYLDYIFKGLRLLELDALGGNSSRGCGQVKFLELKCDGENINLADFNSFGD
jgi:CRISPR-associated protein Csm3